MKLVQRCFPALYLTPESAFFLCSLLLNSVLALAMFLDGLEETPQGFVLLSLLDVGEIMELGLLFELEVALVSVVTEDPFLHGQED